MGDIHGSPCCRCGGTLKRSLFLRVRLGERKTGRQSRCERCAMDSTIPLQCPWNVLRNRFFFGSHNPVVLGCRSERGARSRKPGFNKIGVRVEKHVAKGCPRGDWSNSYAEEVPWLLHSSHRNWCPRGLPDPEWAVGRWCDIHRMPYKCQSLRDAEGCLYDARFMGYYN